MGIESPGPRPSIHHLPHEGVRLCVNQNGAHRLSRNISEQLGLAAGRSAH
jgi:hypothetical protein